MSKRTQRIAERISAAKQEPLHAFVGFDGYIDELVRVVEKGDYINGYSFYRDIASFASRLADAAGKSADMEIIPTDVKLGGNAPIMSNALAKLGVRTTCTGAMGYPRLQEVFAEMAAICDCISLCSPAYTHALEFQDGKIMLANTKPLEQLTWSRIKQQLGLERVISLLDSSDLIALVNWSGVGGAADIWASVYKEVLPRLKKARRCFFFDLADPTKKKKSEIISILDLIHSYMEYGKVILGLNENEAIYIGKAIGSAEQNPVAIGQAIYDRFPISTILIHPVDRCIAITEEGVFTEQGTVVPHPRISTGGGDNFNAGFCLGQLLGLELADSMILGMTASGFYVENGYSPNLSELTERLKRSD